MLACPKCHSIQLRPHDFALDPWRVNMICQCGHTFPAPWTRYNTHLPVLYALGKALPIRQVVELGPGLYSTPVFLNREVFSDVDRVLAIEANPIWANAVREACPDERLIVSSIANGIGHLLPYADDLRAADLTFVDNGGKALRSATIEYIVGLGVVGVVVIHDYREPEYIAAARFDNVWATPFDTAVCWNGGINDAIMDLTEQWKGIVND
jgi:hypothetical protein